VLINVNIITGMIMVIRWAVSIHDTDQKFIQNFGQKTRGMELL